MMNTFKIFLEILDLFYHRVFCELGPCRATRNAEILGGCSKVATSPFGKCDSDETTNEFGTHESWVRFHKD